VDFATQRNGRRGREKDLYMNAVQWIPFISIVMEAYVHRNCYKFQAKLILLEYIFQVVYSLANG
jgi:hypothetical protein